MAANDRIQYARARLITQFRQELRNLGDAPTGAELERLLQRRVELELAESEAAEEISLLQGCIDARGMQIRIEAGDLPTADPGGYLPAGDHCHFTAPVRFGRRRLDHLGHLLLTADGVRFRGAVDLSVGWAEVETIRRDNREIVVSLHDSRWMLRFWCHSYSEAAIGVVIGSHLRRAAGAPSSSLSCEALA